MVIKMNSNYRWQTGGSLELYSNRAQLMSDLLLNAHALTLFFRRI